LPFFWIDELEVGLTRCFGDTARQQLELDIDHHWYGVDAAILLVPLKAFEKLLAQASHNLFKAGLTWCTIAQPPFNLFEAMSDGG
jgi:hypothetical protein